MSRNQSQWKLKHLEIKNDEDVQNNEDAANAVVQEYV